MSTFRITPHAHEDLKNIARYTLKVWGKIQRNKYLQSLDERFHMLAKSPYSGRYRPEVREGYYSYFHASHVIFYLIRDGGIDIIGIPHQNMDIDNYFSTH